MNDVLKINKLIKIYGKKGNTYKALNGIDLVISEGDFVGIMGPSGSGKSTLLNIVSTIDKPTEGTVLIGNKNVIKMKDKELSKFRRKHLGFIFQDFNLLDTLTVKENIALPLALAKESHKKIEEEVEKISKQLGINELLNKYPYEISGGQKQRTAAARAIISKPSLILADEPTGALDSKSSAELLEALQEMNIEDRATIMMVTHDAYAASHCKRVLFIKDGSIYTEVTKKGDRKSFYNELMEVASKIGGDINGTV